MKTVRFVEYYLPDKDVGDIHEYTRAKLYNEIYAFLRIPGFVYDTNSHTIKPGYGKGSIFNMNDMKRIHHDLEMSDESYEVICHQINNNKLAYSENQREIKRYGKISTFVKEHEKFDEMLLPNNQRKIIEDAFNAFGGSIKRGSKYLSFIYSTKVLVDGEWKSINNEYIYLSVK